MLHLVNLSFMAVIAFSLVSFASISYLLLFMRHIDFKDNDLCLCKLLCSIKNVETVLNLILRSYNNV